MSHTASPNAVFNPAQCPLLQGLSPEEQKARMASDPVIRACISSLETEGELLAPCGTARLKPRRKAAPADRPTAKA